MKKNYACLTAEEIGELILSKKDIPTSIFLGGKEQRFVVQPRGTIFGSPQKRKPVKA